VIGGATGSSYTPVAGDVGKAISVRLTGTKTGYTSLTVTSAATEAVIQPAIINLVTPSIGGTKRVGQILTAHAGTWTPSGTTYSYQWFIGGEAVDGATGMTFKLRPRALDETVSVLVTAVYGDLAPVTVSSAETKAIKPGLFEVVDVPQIRGKAQVGNRLRVVDGELSPAATSIEYRWMRDGEVIKRATGAGYKLTKADKGHRISVQVTYGKKGYKTIELVDSKKSVVKKR
jgi:hypothetical protein